jgi:hypothetical protein
MKIHPAVAFVSGLAVAAIVHRPRQISDVCGFIFNNTIAKSAGVGLGLGVATTGILMFRARRKTAEVQTQTGTWGNLIEGLFRLFGPPIVGTVVGALIGVAVTGSRHVTIVVK